MYAAGKYVRTYYIYGGKARICLKVVWLLRSEHGVISSSLQVLGFFEGLVPEEALNEHENASSSSVADEATASSSFVAILAQAILSSRDIGPQYS